jgi:uncharacterized protein YggE
MTLHGAVVPAIILATASFVRAEEPSRVAVSVNGRATAVADTVEVELTVSARAEGSADAEKAFRGKLRTVLEALKEGKAPIHPVKKVKEKDKDKEKPAKKKTDDDDDDDDSAKKPAPKPDAVDPNDDSAATAIPIEVTERGLAFGVKAAKDDAANPFKAIARMNGGAVANPDPPMVFSSKVVATIKGVKKLDPKLVARRVSLVIDVGIDAGADGTDTGTAPTVRFLVDDMEALRSQAYEDAMKKATARATRLATLGGRTLGSVASVRESGVGGKLEDIQSLQVKAVQNMFGSTGGPSDAVTGFEVGAEVDLSLEFDLVGSKEQTSDAAPGANAGTGDLAKTLEALAKIKESGGFAGEVDYQRAVEKVLRTFKK